MHTVKTEPLLLSFGLLLIFFGVLSGETSLWSEHGPKLVSGGSALGVIGLILSILSLRSYYSRREAFFDLEQLLPSAAYAGAIGILFVLTTEWLTVPYSFFAAPSIRGELLLGGILSIFIVRKNAFKAYSVVLLFAVALLTVDFFQHADGRLLFSDDHATFQYRIELLKAHFPNIPFYLPYWDGGLDARSFFATGALNFFLLFAPLWYLFQVQTIYNVCVVLLLFVGFPLFTALACRVQRTSWVIASLAGCLTLSISLSFYRWGLKYGTMGFITSLALTPLVLTLATPVIFHSSAGEKLSLRVLVALTCTGTLLLLWPPAGLTFLPLLVVAALRSPTLLKIRRIQILIALLVFINLPWMALFWRVSKVTSFLNAEEKKVHYAVEVTEQPAEGREEHGNESPQLDDAQEVENSSITVRSTAFRHDKSGLSIQSTIKHLRETLTQANPLLIFLGIPGILLLHRRYRFTYALTVGWTTFVGSALVALKPQLELDRFLIVTLLLLTLPTALSFKFLFERAKESWRSMVLFFPVGALFLVGPFESSKVVLGRSLIHYNFGGANLTILSEEIGSLPNKGRILFSGCVTHELDGGHLAPLAVWNKKPLIASSHAHTLWWYKDIIPNEFRKRGITGVEEFLDLFDVEYVYAHELKWRSFFHSHDSLFEPVSHETQFELFRRKEYVPTRVLQGNAKEVREDESEVTLTPLTPSLVLKYRYFPFLTSSNCTLHPEPITEDITFLRLENCQVETPTRISSIPPWKRLFMRGGSSR